LLAAPTENIELLTKLPTVSEYWSHLLSASIIVLPYNPKAYGDGRGSGIFEEALTIGLPMVCSATSFFVDRLGHMGFAELIFRPYTAAALVQKLLEIVPKLANYDAMLARSQDRFNAGSSAEILLRKLCDSKPS
jgi:hypothetical protein